MDWLNSRLDQLQNLGGKAYGAIKNKGPISARGPKSSWKTGLVGKAASDLKIGGKGFKFGPEQANALIGILGPVVQMLQNRRRR
tara:strand:+ start:58 stop:309 length:252 start_codon:yes stop_codon:yes gene_type:complete